MQPLFLLFQTSLDTGQLPRPWKDATVTPTFKKGCRTFPTNYCPVSMTFIVHKMLESIIKEHNEPLFREQSICSSQHGFRSGLSCVTQLLNVMEDWSSTLEMGYTVDIV